MCVLLTAELQSKLRTLERTSKSLKSEKGILQEEIASLRTQVADKDQGLRGVKGQVQELQEEVDKLTSKLSEVRSQKVKFSKLAREKGEEIGESVCGWGRWEWLIDSNTGHLLLTSSLRWWASEI